MRTDFFSKPDRAIVFAASVVLVGIVGWFDHLTSDLSIVIFYLIPISLSSWYGGRWYGAVVSLLSVAAWHFTNLPWTLVSYSNIIEKLVFFLFVTFVLARLKQTLDDTHRLSRTDPLTGLLNRRSFCEILEHEIERSRRYRHPLSLMYVDVDDFKAVNDKQGHRAGDRLLQQISRTFRSNLRSTDLVARIGGDEFCVLLPETDEVCAVDIARVLQIRFGDTLRGPSQRATVSMGVATFIHPPLQVEEVIHLSDELMFAVKRNGKNSIKHQVYHDGKPREQIIA